MSKKKSWGNLRGTWVPPDVRDEIVDFVREWSMKTEVNGSAMVGWIGIGRSKYHDWRERYGKANEHNGWVPRDAWLEAWEKEAIVRYHGEHEEEGYRRLTYMMLDKDVVAVSPSSVYRVLQSKGLLNRWNGKATKKGKGFEQPEKPHEHWHIDIAYVNICGTFYYLCGVLDGYSRYMAHWEIRESMRESDVEMIVQKSREKFPSAKPRIISDNGPQFVARDFKEFVRMCGMKHVRTSPYYPQSNGKIERWWQGPKGSLREKTPLSVDDARRIVDGFVRHYNDVRLHSAIGYVTPKDKLEGREERIFAERDCKLEKAREQRKAKRLSMSQNEVSKEVGYAAAGTP